ncbi:MAG: extensin family protein [Brevundimonas sp.]|uniref:extensin-like domain-containing protein n=1 Tax=Brevundimonas sp. TaxID=1871086 RepID=UPI0024875EDC|nr:extensin family protein [Brevundimonas sp.]MDI1325766.1 extensin family protein [Brevundimonas sp.]
MRSVFRRLAATASTALLLAGCSPMLPERSAPARYPAAPARTEAPLVGALIDQPVGGGTRSAVIRESAELQQCMAQLTAARVIFHPVPDRSTTAACGLSAAGVLGPDLGTVARMAPGDVEMTCRTALALSVWRRQSLEPAAREILGSDVVQIDQMGAYACRNVNNGGVSGRVSAHSQAAALDFAGVRLRDGRRITVSANWAGDAPEARFLRRIRDDACHIFGTTLSPDYNAVHADHLHLEATDTRFCR